MTNEDQLYYVLLLNFWTTVFCAAALFQMLGGCPNTHPSIDYTYTTRRTNEREP